MDRRRRLVLVAQAALSVLGALVIVGLLWGVARTNSAIWVLPFLLLAVVGVAMTGWGVRALERARFRNAAAAAPDTDWAHELRDVRDSRRIIVKAFEIERRRIERDLHDGAQQYLVSATMKLGEASMLLEQGTTVDGLGVLAPLLEEAHRDAEQALRTLRDTVSGIHPQVLTDLGLFAAVTDMAERSGVNVVVRSPHRLPEIPEEVAAVAWFFCSEALTNIAKHAPGASATLLLGADKDLHVSVMDDGPGGAHLRGGGGLVGMRERLAAFGGSMRLASPDGGPTTLSARIPLLLAPMHEDVTHA